MASNRPRNQITPPREEEEDTDSVSDSEDYESETDTMSVEYESDTEDGASTDDDEGDEEEDDDREDSRDKKEKENVKEQFGEKEEENIVPNCPVCMETWTSEGPHRVCCIPCGHVYGRSCLQKWLKRCGNKVGKCPQCNRKFKPTNIINLYAPRVVVPNDDLKKEMRSLKKKVHSLQQTNNVLIWEKLELEAKTHLAHEDKMKAIVEMKKLHQTLNKLKSAFMEFFAAPPEETGGPIDVNDVVNLDADQNF